MRLMLLLLTPIFLFAQYDTTSGEDEYYTDEINQDTFYNPYYETQEGYAAELQQAESTLPNIEGTYEPYPNYDYYDNEYDVAGDPLYEEGNTGEVPQTNLESLLSFRTNNYSKFKSKRMPSLLGSDGLLKNLDLSYWFLKFYGHPDISNYNLIQLFFKNSILTITLTDLTNNIVEENSYYLSPVKMIKPNEGIFVYSNKEGEIHFIYLRLLLPHLLAMEMVSSFEEAEIIADKSITDLGVFVLQ